MQTPVIVTILGLVLGLVLGAVIGHYLYRYLNDGAHQIGQEPRRGDRP